MGVCGSISCFFVFLVAGFDRHLLGLYLIAKEEGRPTPELFSDPLYTRRYCLQRFSFRLNQLMMLLWFLFKNYDPKNIPYYLISRLIITFYCFRVPTHIKIVLI